MPPLIADRRRAGFSLVELLVAVLLVAPVVTMAALLALQAGRSASLAARLAESEAALMHATQVLEAELAPLAPGDGLLASTPVLIRYRAQRAVGRWCRWDSAGPVVPNPPGYWAASRLPVAGRDSVVLELADSASPTGYRRLRLPLATPPVATTCPSAPAGLLLPIGGGGAAAARGLIVTEEVAELEGYQSGGETWLGMRLPSAGAGIEPLAGPFAIGGVRFEAVDSAGNPGAAPAAAWGVRVELEPPDPRLPVRTLLIRFRG